VTTTYEGTHNPNGQPQGLDEAALVPQHPNVALPPGVHPMDPRSSEPDYVPGPADIGKAHTRSRAPWQVSNGKAAAVFQRAASDFSVTTLKLTTTTQILGRQPGRVAVVLSVPTTLADGTTPLGVIFGSDRGAVDQGLATGIGDIGVLNPGDTYTLATEASVYAAPISGNATGAVQVVDLFNPTGGGLGST